MYEYFQKLLDKYGLTAYKVAKATNISTAAMTGWKKGKWKFKQDKLQKIADYFGVPLSYFSTGEIEESKIEESPAEIRAKHDLSIVFNQTLENFSNCDEPIYFNGKKLEKEELDLFSKAVKNLMAIMDYKQK